MSDIKYTSIDFSKYEYSLPEEIREFAKNPKPKNKFKELLSSFVPQGVSDVFDKTLDVGKTALGVGSSIDRDKAKQDKLDKANKKVDYKKLSSFLKNGFTNYKEQYDLHPVLYEFSDEKSKKNKISYMIVSMVTNDSVTLQPYKLDNTELYRLYNQESHGTKIKNIVRFIGLTSYVRCNFKNIQVSNISTDSNPLSDFKSSQTMLAPIYKLLNKFNPELGTKYSCEFIFYDDKQRKLEWVKDVFIEQVTQNRVVLSRYVEGKEGKKVQSKIQVNLSLIIPAFADELEKKESNDILYEPIFTRLQEEEEGEDKGEKKNLKNKKLVLFYIRPFLYIEDSKKEQTSFTARMDTFDFSNYLNSGLYGEIKSLVTGDTYSSGSDSDLRTPRDKEKFLRRLAEFIEKYKGKDLLIYGYDYIRDELRIRKLFEKKLESDILDINSINQLNNLKFIYSCKFVSQDEQSYTFEVIKRINDGSSNLEKNEITAKIFKEKKMRIPKKYFLEVFENGSYPFIVVEQKIFKPVGQRPEELNPSKPPEDNQQNPSNAENNEQPNIPNVVEIPDSVDIQPKLNTTTVEGINEIIQKVKAEFNTSPNFIVDIAQYVAKIQDKKQTIDANTSKKLQLCIDLVSSVGKEVNIKSVKNTITDSRTFTNSIVSSASLEEFNNNYTDGRNIKSKIKNVEIKDKITKIELELDTIETKDIFGIGVLDNKIQLYVSSTLTLTNTEIENIINDLDFDDSSSSPPSDNTTTPESLHQTLEDTSQGQGELTQEEIDALLGGNPQEREEVVQEINTIEDETEKKKLAMLTLFSEILSSNLEIDVIELNDDVDDDTFMRSILYANSMDELSQYVNKKYTCNLKDFEIDNHYVILDVDNLKEVDLSNMLEQEPSNEETNTTPTN